MISKACVVGAYQTKLEEIAKLDDVELTVVVPPSWREKGNEQQLERVHTTGYRLQVLPICFNGRFHLFHFVGLARLLKELQPDVVHVDEEPYNLATALAVRAAKRVGARVVAFTWQNLNRAYPWPFSRLEQYVYTHSDAIMAGNHSAVDVLRAKGFTGSAPVIPQFGVDANWFSPCAYAHRPFTVGYAGRLVESKGLMTLLGALEETAGEWRLLLVGDGEMAGRIHEWVCDHGLEDRVELVARVPSNDMPSMYQRMDVLVLPSLTTRNWMEQFGRVLIEAMSCGVPVVGSNSGEIPNVIGDAGLVFAEGNVHDLADCLIRVRDEDGLAVHLSSAGRERVMACFTQARIAEQTVAAYWTVMGRPQVVDGTERGIIAS